MTELEKTGWILLFHMVLGAVAFLMALACQGCLGPTSVSWRGVTHMTVQHATTDGAIMNMPGEVRGRVDADKTTEVDFPENAIKSKPEVDNGDEG